MRESKGKMFKSTYKLVGLNKKYLNEKNKMKKGYCKSFLIKLYIILFLISFEYSRREI